MKLENQVCSLELAKKLKELGVKQESIFYWWNHGVGPSEETKVISETEYHQVKILRWVQEFYSAFTVAELGEMLPAITRSGKTLFEERSKKYNCDIFSTNDLSVIKHNIHAETEADARAKMLIYLIENKLISVEEINKNL